MFEDRTLHACVVSLSSKHLVKKTPHFERQSSSCSFRILLKVAPILSTSRASPSAEPFVQPAIVHREEAGPMLRGPPLRFHLEVSDQPTCQTIRHDVVDPRLRSRQHTCRHWLPCLPGSLIPTFVSRESLPLRPPKKKV